MDINRKAPVVAVAELDIDAPRERVWEVLADIRGWPDWNPSVTRVILLDEFAPQSEFHWRFDGVGIVSVLQEVDAPKRLLWSGRSPGIRAIRLWSLEEREGGTRVKTEESFSGFLAWLLSRPLGRLLQQGLNKWLLYLKEECEGRNSPAE